jgi:hypothetical protein
MKSYLPHIRATKWETKLGEMNKQFLPGKLKGLRPKRRRENNIETDLKEVRFGRVGLDSSGSKIWSSDRLLLIR